jgi:pSer/pThr/pTyr-binding forkhead associated (FHA) protein
MKVSLTVLSTGSASGKSLPINVAQFIIGRDPGCNLRPASAMISKRHCAVLVKDGKVFLRDFDSTNGTFVNDAPIKGEVGLKDGDVVKVGPLTFKAVIEAQVAPGKPTPPPKPRDAASADEDAAAELLSIDDDVDQTRAATSDTKDEEIPGGSTIMEMPAFAAPPAEDKTVTSKPADNKAKAKPATGAAQDAAKAILEKLRSGRRK